MIKKRIRLKTDGLENAADCLRILAHPKRLQIVQLLQEDTRFCVTEIAEKCELTQPTASEHLRLMQRCGFLNSDRDGRTVYYSICEPHLNDMMNCLQKRFG